MLMSNQIYEHLHGVKPLTVRKLPTTPTPPTLRFLSPNLHHLAVKSFLASCYVTSNGDQ